MDCPFRTQPRNFRLKYPKESVWPPVAVEPRDAVTSTPAIGDRLRGSEFRSNTTPGKEIGLLAQLSSRPLSIARSRASATTSFTDFRLQAFAALIAYSLVPSAQALRLESDFSSLSTTQRLTLVGTAPGASIAYNSYVLYRRRRFRAALSRPSTEILPYAQDFGWRLSLRSRRQNAST